MSLIVYGAGKFGKALCDYYIHSKSELVVAIADRYSTEKDYRGIPIITPDKIVQYSYDKVIISMQKNSVIRDAYSYLVELGVSHDNIMILMNEEELLISVLVDYNQYDENCDKRVRWLKEFADYISAEGIAGDIAECGVNRGEFAFYMNKY